MPRRRGLFVCGALMPGEQPWEVNTCIPFVAIIAFIAFIAHGVCSFYRPLRIGSTLRSQSCAGSLLHAP